MKRLIVYLFLVFGLGVSFNVNADDYPFKASINNQYEYATQFLKDGDYLGGEKAFKKFIEINPNHKLAGNAQYWYAETFRIRQLYTDAAAAYLEGYRKYPQGEKAPVNLLKLGMMLVQVGEKEVGCKMIVGMAFQYPKASVSVKQKAKYEANKLKCDDREKNFLTEIAKLSKKNDLEKIEKKKKELLLVEERTKKLSKEPKQEEFKPKSTNQDKDPPVIQIASNITVSDTTYEIEGIVKDNSENIFVEIDGQTIQAKNGKFKLQRYSPIDHQLKIVAVDQWGNRSEPKLVDIKIELQVAKSASIIEPLNPSNLKVKADRNKVALIIGVEKYENTPSAKFASLDAKYFKDYARKAFGVLDDNINLLTDEEANLSKTTSAFFKWLPSKIKSNKTDLIIFYAGHGLASSDGKDKYILPFNADPDLLSRTAISRKEIFDQIISLKPRSVTIFLDTCYSGVSRDEQMLLASARPLRVIADDDEKLPDNFTIFSASENDQVSSGLESAKHGIFSYYLMKGLEGKADLDQDGKLTNNELLTYLDNNVSEKALNLGRQQNPTLTGNPDQILARY